MMSREIDEDAETVMEATGEALKSGAATAAATGQRVKEAMARTAENASDTSGARLSAACRAAAIPLATAAIAWFGTVQLLQLAFSGNRGTSS